MLCMKECIQIVKTLESTSIRHRSDPEGSYRCLIDVDTEPVMFARRILSVNDIHLFINAVFYRQCPNSNI